MCIRDRPSLEAERTLFEFTHAEVGQTVAERWALPGKYVACLLYTSDAADERSSVDLGGRRIIKKTKTGGEEDHRHNL